VDIAIRRRRSRPRIEALEIRTLLSGAGALDPTFGGGYGDATISLGLQYRSGLGAFNDGPDSVIAELNGKIVVSGTVQGDDGRLLAVARFNADGSPDDSFGSLGQVQLPISDPEVAPTVSTIVLSDGKIIEATSATDGGGNATFVAVRLNVNGSLDTSFGVDGVAQYGFTTTPVSDRLGTVVAAVAQTNGKIVLLGNTVYVRYQEPVEQGVDQAAA